MRIWRIIILCCIANLINAADRVIMPLAIIPISDYYKWDLHQHGWILSSFSVGYMSSMILGGGAAKRFGGSVVLLLAVFLWSITSLATPSFAFSTSALVSLRFLLGFGEGIGLPAIMHLLSYVVPPDERSRALGYLVAFGSIGQIVATIIYPHLPWSSSFYLFGFLGLTWIFCWIAIFTELRLAERTSEEFCNQQARLTKQSLHWYDFVWHWPLWAIYAAHFSMNWSSYIVMQWLPTYLARYLGANKSELMFTALPYFTNCVASIVSGHVADNFIRRQWSVLSVRRLMTAIGLVGPGIFLFIFSMSTSVYVAIIAITVSMCLSAFNSAGHLSNHVEVAPNHAGITFAISNTLATIPGILCGPMTAQLVVQSGGRWFPVFVLAGCVNLVGAVIYCSQSSSVSVF